MEPWPPLSPTRTLRFREASQRLDLEIQRSQSWLVIRGRYRCFDDRSIPKEVVLRSKERDALAVTALAGDGSFLIETRWSRKSTILLQVGDYFVPVVRALDRLRMRGSESMHRENDRRRFASQV